MALPKFYKVVTDQQGNIVPGVLCSVYNKGTAVLASLYQDDAGTVPLSNPLTNDATYGSVKFYINPGHFDLSFTKPGYTFEPIYDMQVPQDVLTLGTMATQNAHAVAITGGSATGLSVLGTEGTFVAAATGFAAVSGIAYYTVLGRTVVLDLPDLVGTSNATVFAILGLPAALACPRMTRWPVLVQDNGVFQFGLLQIDGTTIDVYSTPGFGGWTASGAKALYAPTVTYLRQT